MEEIVVNDETLDSLITMSYIYINQGLYKEAMRIYNKLSEKYPDNREVKGILEEITKRQGS
jgi:tetratricopeptide (TPR) repeat protein